METPTGSTLKYRYENTCHPRDFHGFGYEKGSLEEPVCDNVKCKIRSARQTSRKSDWESSIWSPDLSSIRPWPPSFYPRRPLNTTPIRFKQDLSTFFPLPRRVAANLLGWNETVAKRQPCCAENGAKL
ncbi:hypothetical protein CEXT_722541 [Caerostris extrusa]|uniref:Uncharacterized protein n=1 Tax=Caerostris extrusa TaxID=172846 RepID=A0AAV4V3V3_CAEEX|nr:hypothetical protein CEXT_722541 [Caerostris extrusa]